MPSISAPPTGCVPLRSSDRASLGGKAVRAMLAPASPTADIVPWEAGGGQAPRQPGQVRKEAAVTSVGLGRSSGLPPLNGFADERFGDRVSRSRPQIPPFDLRR